MVFPSVPVYLDPPNWQQQPNQQAGAAAGSENPPFPPQQPLPPPGGGGGGGGGGGSSSGIRHGSMADKARLAKLPQPEISLKCPRCESSNTKFCYFNNYSLTQPRHFCKTCRRYWTRGGALRSVPVGGGCRRNKRSKGSNGSRSKSPAGAGSSSSSGLASHSCTTDIRGHIPSLSSQLPMFPPLHNLGDYNVPNIALSFNGINPPTGATAAAGGGMEFQIGSTSSNGGTDGGGGSGSILPSGLVEPWRMQQQAQLFPFLANLETLNRHYPFEGEGIVPPNYVGGQLRPNKPLDAGVNQLASVKMEETQRLGLSRNSSGVSENRNDQFWGGNAWSDLPGFASSSTTSHLF